MSFPVSHRSAARFLRIPPRFVTFGTLRLMLVVGVVLLPRLSSAQWTATIGAQSQDLARQSLAFLPNEMWIHAGESITWTLATNERHTVTFLPANQAVPDVSTDCPGFAKGAATFDGNTCASSPRMSKGQTFAVTFPVAGNFKLTCLLHPDMTGTIHVLDASESLLRDQAFYDGEAEREANALLDEEGGGHTRPEHHHAHDAVAVGAGQISATGGGTATLSVMRFQAADITVHAGDTVEWINDDPVTPHTVTFGTEPQDPTAPSANVSIDPDGTRHAMLTSPADSVSSGFLQAAPQDRVGLPQTPPGTTRFRLTFSTPGVYPYICALHDGLGMKGHVTVLP